MLLVAGCAMEPEPPPEGPRIAFADDFAGFRDWEAYRLPTDSLTDGHFSSDERWLYVDRPVPGLPASIPEGTILVKTVEDGPLEEWTVHAMVHRGGGYNPDGCEGWEFFVLKLDADGEVYVDWRGTGDRGAVYIDPSGVSHSCNSCHLIAYDRDCVFSRELLAPSPTP